MDNTWLSILPATITIAVAIWSKKVLPSLLLGLLVGSYLLNHSVTGGLETAIANAVKILSDKDNLQVLLFLYLFSGLIALVRKAGGITAFSAWVGKFVKSEKGVFFTLWALIPVTFIDCAFRIIGAGSIIRPLADKHKIAKERLAFMLNNTASPIVEMIPIATTFVGFNIAIYCLQKYPVKTMTADLISGGNQLMEILAILVLAWSLGAVSLAVSGGSGIPICVAAVITGGTFGDVTSPVAGMTNMSSNAGDADQVKYLKYANPYNFTALVLAAILFLIFGIIGGQSLK